MISVAEFQGRSDSDATAAERRAAQTAAVLVVITAAAFTAACGDPTERAAKRWKAAATLRADNAAAVERTRARLMTEAEASGEGVEQAAEYLKEAQEKGEASRAEVRRAEGAVGIVTLKRRVQEAYELEADVEAATRDLWNDPGRLTRETAEAAEVLRSNVRAERRRIEAGFKAAQWLLPAILKEATSPEAQAFQKVWREQHGRGQDAEPNHGGDQMKVQPVTPAEVDQWLQEMRAYTERRRR